MTLSFQLLVSDTPVLQHRQTGKAGEKKLARDVSNHRDKDGTQWHNINVQWKNSKLLYQGLSLI